MANTDRTMQIVIGLGKTGLSCIRYLLAQGVTDICVCDTRDTPPEPAIQSVRSLSANIQIVTGSLDADLLKQAARIIVSPGVAIANKAIQKAIAKGVPVVGDIELFALDVDKPVIAVTGSNGKSTVVTLIGEMLRAHGLNVAIAGNIGLPALDAIADDIDFYVLELSSFQLETTHSLAPVAATVLNISEDHMDRYPSMQAYAEAKSKIYHLADYGIYNFYDLLTQINLPAKAECFALQPPSSMVQWGYANNHIYYGEDAVFDCAQMRIKGVHNIENAMVALALVNESIGCYDKALDVLKTFAGLPHRCQWVGEKDGVAWYNDSKATNVGAALAAIDGLGAQIRGKIVLLAGGDGKGADFKELIVSVKEYAKHVICFGRDGHLIKKALESAVSSSLVDDLSQAVEQAHQYAVDGDIVLLSPACASLDQYKNFEHRGRHFMQLAEQYL